LRTGSNDRPGSTTSLRITEELLWRLRENGIHWLGDWSQPRGQNHDTFAFAKGRAAHASRLVMGCILAGTCIATCGMVEGVADGIVVRSAGMLLANERPPQIHSTSHRILRWSVPRFILSQKTIMARATVSWRNRWFGFCVPSSIDRDIFLDLGNRPHVTSRRCRKLKDSGLPVAGV
jgi:hypothetical protein